MLRELSNEDDFMRNRLVPDAPFTLNGANISEGSSFVYLGREVNMMNDLAPKLSRTKRDAREHSRILREQCRRQKHPARLTMEGYLVAVVIQDEMYTP
uniref:OmpR/PhoB-type domain-containing protein n=1 Tax=Haemonchus contortus TaxID=6289 RepID=A0A7I4Z4A1_HAECO